MEIVFGCEAVEDEACGGDDHGGEEDGETHFGFADAVVAAGEVGGETVRGEGEGDGEDVAGGVGDGDEAGVFDAPVVGRLLDFDGEGEVECEGAETDIDSCEVLGWWGRGWKGRLTVGADYPEYGWDSEICKWTDHGHEELSVAVDTVE
jgi:hypothetical protein